ncbi:MAG TPA: thioredoxin family protein [Burkholderiales bacterium]|nr:thioredoxin family protein [Burkholderiales bacterium]
MLGLILRTLPAWAFLILQVPGVQNRLALAAEPSARINAPAPDFTATDSNGKTRKLSEQKGKIVVLEWTNNGCPFVGKHYGSGNMQSLQKRYTAQGVVWFTVVSSAPGSQGYVTAAEANRDTERRGAAPTAVLLDPTGALGHLYGAQATPHMYVISAEGQLVYMGAIDDTPSADPADIASSRNYVAAALEELKAGKRVTVTATRAYGCSVKYASGG